jgi:hypothetical protein
MYNTSYPKNIVFYDSKTFVNNDKLTIANYHNNLIKKEKKIRRMGKKIN